MFWESLHGTTLSLPGNTGQFDMRLYPYWFYVSSAYTANSTSINVKIPGGTPLRNPADTGSPRVSLPNSGYLKLQSKSQLATISSVSPGSPADGATITFGINPGFPYDIQTDEELFLVYTDNNTTSQPAVPQDGSIDFPGTNPVAQLLPAQNGSFRVYNEDNDKMDYTYLEKFPPAVDPGNPPTTITLSGIQHQNDGDPSVFPFTIDNTSEIYFGRNLAVFSTSTFGTGNMAARKTVGNYTDVGLDGGFFKDKDTISFEKDIGDFTPTMNDPNPALGQPIEIDTGIETIQLGGDLPDGYGSVWYKGYTDIADCIQGNCLLGRGFRAYFEFTFDNTDNSIDSTDFGDGFTFSLVSGANYTNGDTGLGGEYMGYAGPGLSSNGLQPPKLAVEIDTYPESRCRQCVRRATAGATMNLWPTIPPWFTGVKKASVLLMLRADTFVSDPHHLPMGSPRTGAPPKEPSASGSNAIPFSTVTEIRAVTGCGDRTPTWKPVFPAHRLKFFPRLGYRWMQGAINTANPFTGAGTWYFIAITWDDATDQLKVYSGNQTTVSLLAENLAWTGDMNAIGIITENLFLNSSGGNGIEKFCCRRQGLGPALLRCRQESVPDTETITRCV